MDKLVIKITLCAHNSVEAEMIRILRDKKNKAGHLKMAAIHSWKLLEKMECNTQQSGTAHTPVKSDTPSGREDTIEKEIDFSKTFDNF
ncbi:MAG: hypothetical protein AMK70_04525 [Nitrospira bacterium SG8_35_1]|nr:MAG: hypothetical protein AMK70_04525 [Nitrospira bacterium SG8_35_1]